MIFTFAPVIASQAYCDFYGEDQPIIDTCALFSSPLAGLLNLFAFCLDPIIHSAFIKTYKPITSDFKINVEGKNKIASTNGIELSSEASLSFEDINEPTNLDENLAIETFVKPF